MSLRERQFNQVFGVRDAETLRINMVCQKTSDNEDIPIYLLVHGKEGSVATVGFTDMHRSFTFAFSTPQLAENFVSVARKQKLLTQVGRILPMTVGEYFERKKQREAKPDLCIDPSPEMMSHPNVQLGIQNSN